MGATKSLATGLLLVGVFMSFMPPSAATDFIVGGRAGWVQSPVVPYNNWAGATRFQVNDSLVFKYKQGDDSVLVVSKSGYDSCNTTGPLEKLDGGYSVYKLSKTGPNYFISGEAGHCTKGQKLVVVVLAIKNKPSPSPPSVAVPPALATPPSVAVPPSLATPPVIPPSIAMPPSLATPVMPPVIPPSIAMPPFLITPATPPVIPPSIAMPPSLATPPSPFPSAEAPKMASPTPEPLSTPVSGSGLPPVSAPPPSDKGSSPSVSSVSRVTLGMVTLLLGGVLIG